MGKKYLNLGSTEDEKNPYSLGTAWGVSELRQWFHFGWTIPLIWFYQNKMFWLQFDFTKCLFYVLPTTVADFFKNCYVQLVCSTSISVAVQFDVTATSPWIKKWDSAVCRKLLGWITVSSPPSHPHDADSPERSGAGIRNLTQVSNHPRVPLAVLLRYLGWRCPQHPPTVVWQWEVI